MKKSFIKEIYYGNLCEAERSTKDLQESQEFRDAMASYEKFKETFTCDQLDLFNEWYINEARYIGLEHEQNYINGFKTGMYLILELLDFEPTN